MSTPRSTRRQQGSNSNTNSNAPVRKDEAKNFTFKEILEQYIQNELIFVKKTILFLDKQLIFSQAIIKFVWEVLQHTEPKFKKLRIRIRQYLRMIRQFDYPSCSNQVPIQSKSVIESKFEVSRSKIGESVANKSDLCNQNNMSNAKVSNDPETAVRRLELLF